MTAVVARAKAAALAMMQEWELPAAAELLGMWEPQLSPVDGAWLARVRGYCRRSAGRGGGAQEEEKAWSRVWDYSAAITFAHPPLLGVLESECAAVSESVLDVLVLSTRPERLRVCVDLLLRQQQPSIRGPVAELLENPVTAPLLLAALDKLVRALLDAGDVPLARSYLCSLAQCLLVCPSTAALAAYLSLLRRTAQALVTVSGLSPFLQQQREELRGRWSTIARSLAPWDRGPSPAATSLFAQRRTMFHRLCSSSSSEPTPPPPSSPPAVTRVAIRARGGCITVHRECRSPAQDPYTAMLSLPDDAWVSEALDSMGSILLENKAQLGSGSGAVIERPRSAAVAAAEEAGGSPACGEETSTSSDGKVLWWSRRFALDEEIRAVAKAMQRALGPASLLLLGDVDFSLWQGLWSLSEAAVAAEDAALFDPGGSEGRLQLVQILSVLLQGLPFLAPLCNGFSPRLGRYSQKARYTPPTAPYNSAHGCGGDEEGCCPTCSALVSGTVASLEGVLAAELQKVTVQSGPGAVAECARRLSSRLVPSTFKLLYDSLASGSSAREGHVDLLAVPRGHVCLELDHRLQALPWEGLDVLRTLSSSRVPVGGCRNTLRAPVSFARALLYREGALPAAMQALLDAQSGWELVDAGDDDRASPPDGESPLCTRLFKERAGLYVYMGHRGGEQLLARRQLYDRVPSDTFPAVLLMGCSSARLTGSDAAGWCGSYGLPLAYLHAGAPAAVGCMWDVTDGDIDKTTLKLLEWCVRGGTGTGAAATMTLGAALAKARTSCRLPYLTGVATVLFSGSACPLFGHSSFGHRNDVT